MIMNVWIYGHWNKVLPKRPMVDYQLNPRWRFEHIQSNVSLLKFAGLRNSGPANKIVWFWFPIFRDIFLWKSWHQCWPASVSSCIRSFHRSDKQSVRLDDIFWAWKCTDYFVIELLPPRKVLPPGKSHILRKLLILLPLLAWLTYFCISRRSFATWTQYNTTILVNIYIFLSKKIDQHEGRC